MNKFTYNELGPESWYQYDSTQINKPTTLIVSNTIETINVVNGDDNGIKKMITEINNIGDDIYQLDDGCFQNCVMLSSINLPPTIQFIGNNSFKNCYNLSSFKDDVFNMPTYMGDGVFENCDFKKIYIKNNIHKNFNTNNEYNDGDDVIIGKKTFSNNRNLKNISVDNIIFSQEMFENCTSLSSITVNKDANNIFSSSSPFKNCEKLTELTLPNVFSYFDIDENFLKGSNISTFILSDMTYNEAEIAIGKNKKAITVTNPDISVDYGCIYFYDTHNLDNIFINCINKHIPLIIIECYVDCSICKSFRHNILMNPEFQNWLKNDFGKCSIMYCNDGGGTRKPPAIPPNENIEFSYTTKNGETKIYNTKNNMWLSLKTRTNGSLKIEETPPKQFHGFKSQFGPYWNEIKINVDENGNIVLYKLNDTFKQLIIDENKKSHSFNCGVMEILNKYDDILDTQNYYQLETKNPILTYQVSGWKKSLYPYIGYYYRNNNDVTITSGAIKLTEEQKKSFLDNNFFEINYTGMVGDSNFPDGALINEVNVQFNPSTSSDKKSYMFVINEKIMFYNIKINITSNAPTWQMTKVRNISLAFDGPNIYILCYNFKDDLTPLKLNLTRNVDSAKQAIEGFYNNFFGTTITPPEIIKTEIPTIDYSGNCWGVEHDCDVIDKDGKVHHYKYNSSKT